jgi:putative transposase
LAVETFRALSCPAIRFWIGRRAATQPGTFADPLTEVLRSGARALLAQAVEAEVAALLASHADKLTEDGRQRLVRHGHLPEREIMTGIGPVAVRCPRVRDRVDEGS